MSNYLQNMVRLAILAVLAAILSIVRAPTTATEVKGEEPIKGLCFARTHERVVPEPDINLDGHVNDFILLESQTDRIDARISMEEFRKNLSSMHPKVVRSMIGK